MSNITINNSSNRSAQAINTDLLSDEEKGFFDNLKTLIEKAEYIGFGRGSRKNYDVPSYIPSKNETTLHRGGASIVLGLDRPSNIFSGFGGDNSSHCAAIDIVVGRLGHNGRQKTKSGRVLNVDPNFKADAARIYVSQKSDPDGYFGLANVGFSTSKTSPRSTIVLKADTLRLVSRENVKIITRTDENNSQGASLTNAYVGNYGISLVALNDEKGVQPMVKGQNLVDCLKSIIESIHDLRKQFENFLEADRDLTMTLLKHTHNSPFFGSSTSPSFGMMPDGIQSLLDTVMNVQLQLPTVMEKLNSIQLNYLETPGGTVAVNNDTGQPYHILSRYNKTN